MHFFNILVAISAAATSVSAVTIRNYRTGTCKGNYLQCSNVPAQDCCDLAQNRVYSSSLFLGLPTTAVGAICAGKGRLNCGTIKKAGHGLSLCLGNGNSKGSYWFDCRSCRKRDGLGTREIDVASISGGATPASGVSKPDIVAIEGHQFRIDGTTPPQDVASILHHFETESDYAAIPEGLKKYELAEPIGE